MENTSAFKTGINYHQHPEQEEKSNSMLLTSISQPGEVDFLIQTSVSPANPLRLLDPSNAPADEKRASIYAYLDKGFREHTSSLVSSLNSYMSQIISGLFQELREDIQNRKLFVLFEQSLGCDPMTDHLAAKDVLPIYEPFIGKAENTFRRLTLHKFKHEIEMEFCSAIIAELQARLKIEDNNLHISNELERMRIQCKVLVEEHSLMTKQWQQERERLIQQVNTLSEQVIQKKRVGNVYKPDFMESHSAWDSELVIPDFKNAPSKGAKEILELETKLGQEIKEREKLRTELDAALAKYASLLEKVKKIPEMQGEIDRLKQYIEELVQKIAEQDDLIANQKAQIDDLMDQLQALQKNYDKLEKDYLSYQDIIDSMNMSRSEDQNERERLRKQVAELSKRLAAIEAERDKYKQQALKAEGERNMSLVNMNEHTVKSARLPSFSSGGGGDNMRDILAVKQFLYELTGFNLLTSMDGFTEEFICNSSNAQQDEQRVKFATSTPGGTAKPIVPTSAPREISKTPRKTTPRSTAPKDDSTVSMTSFDDNGSKSSRKPSMGSLSAAIAAAAASTPGNGQQRFTPGSASGRRLSKNVIGDSQKIAEQQGVTKPNIVIPNRGEVYKFADSSVNPAFFNPGIKNPYDAVVSGFYADHDVVLSTITEKLGVNQSSMKTIRDIIGRFFSGDHVFTRFMQLLVEGALDSELLAQILAGLHTGVLQSFLEDNFQVDEDGNVICAGDSPCVLDINTPTGKVHDKGGAGAGSTTGMPVSGTPHGKFGNDGGGARGTGLGSKSSDGRRISFKDDRDAADSEKDGKGDDSGRRHYDQDRRKPLTRYNGDEGVSLTMPPQRPEDYDRAGPDISSHRSGASNLSAEEMSASGVETLPDGTVIYWKRTQTMLTMQDMSELLELHSGMFEKGTNTSIAKKHTSEGSSMSMSSKHNLYGSEGHISKEETSLSSARGLPPDILKNKQIADYIDERLQIERDRVRDEVSAEQELEDIERIRVAVEIAASAIDFWCQVNCDDSESNQSKVRSEDSVSDSIQHIINKMAKPGFQVKYNREPKDWTTKGVFERLYRNAEEIRARLKMKRAEHQRREALLYAKYLRSQNSILKDDTLLITATEYETLSENYAKEAQNWGNEVKKLSVTITHGDQHRTSRASNVGTRTSEVLRQTGKLSTVDLIEEANQYASKEHLIRITSVAPKSPNMEDIIASTIGLRSTTRNPGERTCEKIMTTFDIEGSSLRATPRSSMAGSLYRTMNNTPRESITSSLDMLSASTPMHAKSMSFASERRRHSNLKIREHSVRHSIKQQSPGSGQTSYSAELMTATVADVHTGSRGGKAILVASSVSGIAPGGMGKKAGPGPRQFMNFADHGPKKIFDQPSQDSEHSEPGPLLLEHIATDNPRQVKSSNVLPQINQVPEYPRSFSGKGLGASKVIYDQYGKLMPAQEVQDIVAYRYIFGNSAALKVKDVGRRLLVSVPDSTCLIEVSKETLWIIKANVDKLVEYFQVPGISNMYGNDVVGRAASAKRNASAKRYSLAQDTVTHDDRLDKPDVSIDGNALPAEYDLKDELHANSVICNQKCVTNEDEDDHVVYLPPVSAPKPYDSDDVLAAPRTPVMLYPDIQAASTTIRVEEYRTNGVTNKESIDSDFIVPSTVTSGVIKEDRFKFERDMENALSNEMKKDPDVTGQLTPPPPSIVSGASKHRDSFASSGRPTPMDKKTPYREKINHLDEEGSVTTSNIEYGLSVVEVQPNTKFSQQREEPVTLTTFKVKKDDSLSYHKKMRKARDRQQEKEQDSPSPEASDSGVQPAHDLEEDQRQVQESESMHNQVASHPRHDGLADLSEDQIKVVSQTYESMKNGLTPPLEDNKDADKSSLCDKTPGHHVEAHKSARRRSIIWGIDRIPAEPVLAFTSTHDASVTDTLQRPPQGMLSLRINDNEGVLLDTESLMYHPENALMPSNDSNHAGSEMLLKGQILNNTDPNAGVVDPNAENYSNYEHFKLQSYNPRDSNFVVSSLHIKGTPSAIHQINNFIQNRDQKTGTDLKRSISDSVMGEELRESLGPTSIKVTSHQHTSEEEPHVTLQKGTHPVKHGFISNNYLAGKALPQEPFIKGPAGPINAKGLLAAASDTILTGRHAPELSTTKFSTSGSKHVSESDSASQPNIFAQPRLYMSRLHQDLQKAREADGSTIFFENQS